MSRALLGSDVGLEYELLGPAHGEPLLLIGGLGSQLVSWDDAFCDELVGRGYRVIRYDNRDSGLSTAFDDRGVPDLLGLIFGTGTAPPYTLDDMVADAAGLLTHLGIKRAQVLGLSLGGMVAQLLALEHPTLVMSVVAALSGPPGRPDQLPAPPVVRALLRPPTRTFEEQVECAVELREVLAAQDGAFDRELARRRAEVQLRRAFQPGGTLRQAAAVLASPNRMDDLAGLQVPVMLVHGDLDPLIPFASAEAASRVIPRCELVPMHRLGHDLPPRVALALIDRIVTFHQSLS